MPAVVVGSGALFGASVFVCAINVATFLLLLNPGIEGIDLLWAFASGELFSMSLNNKCAKTIVVLGRCTLAVGNLFAFEVGNGMTFAAEQFEITGELVSEAIVVSVVKREIVAPLLTALAYGIKSVDKLKS